MSNLQRSFAKAKLSNLPFNPPRPLNVLDDDDYFDEVAEQEDSLRPLPSPNAATTSEDDSSSASSASSVSSTGTIIPSPSQKLFARGKAPQNSTSRFAPLPWTDFFSQELYLTPDHPARITHHVYVTPPTSPSAPVFVMHHGAGSSGLSFAAVSAELQKQVSGAGLLALDARGHGETTIGDVPAASTPDGILDISLDALSGDLERAWTAACNHLGWPATTPVILVGHSLGGAVVATVAKAGRLRAKLLGFAVLDVVEGSAMDALQSMTAYLATRPRSFASVEEGIEWHMRSRTIRTAKSARASVPALLKPETREEPVLPSPTTASGPKGSMPPVPSFADEDTAMTTTDSMSASEEHPGDAVTAAGSASKTQNGTATQRWTWRTDLAATQPFWENWFVGLSSKFLTARGGKLLLLAGTDRLDKELMIGQMQGKYQLQVFPEAGHFLHEDTPEKTATILADFWRRNDGSKLVLPPKVGDLLKQGKLSSHESR